MSISKSKQGLRDFLWVRSPKALLASVAEVWYHQCRELWAPTHCALSLEAFDVHGLHEGGRRPNKLQPQRDNLKADLCDSCPQPRFSNLLQNNHILHSKMFCLIGVQLLAMEYIHYEVQEPCFLRFSTVMIKWVRTSYRF